jgi:DnaJ-class molecular chaperone
MDTCASEAFGDPVGNLLLRFLDNHHAASGRQAKRALSDKAARKFRLSTLDRNAATHHVLMFMFNQKCNDCFGRGQRISESNVYSACLACNATGLANDPPSHWVSLHHSIMRDAQARIGQSLRVAAAQYYEQV